MKIEVMYTVTILNSAIVYKSSLIWWMYVFKNRIMLKWKNKRKRKRIETDQHHGYLICGGWWCQLYHSKGLYFNGMNVLTFLANFGHQYY